MKNNIFSKTIAVFLTLIFVIGLNPSIGFAQTSPSSSPFGEVRGFNKSVFDSHFSRADRELSPDRWLAEAKWGVTQAICAWELIASGLYENPLIFEEAKIQIEKWSNEELETRFSKWLMGRFFAQTAEKAVTELFAMFGETQKNYSWHLDDEGNIIFDDKTGDPSVIRPGEDGREFSHDLIKWRNEAEILVKTKGDSFDTAIIHLYPELLAYIPEELRETMSGVINAAGTSIKKTIKREFENIAAREESIFTSRRTRDIWSLRKKSDDEAARIFTEKLISETEESCTKGIEELNARIEAASAGTGDLAILGEDWLRLYKEQFDKGLKAWEEAEERFFIRRIEWEQDSFRLFSEGEEIWLAAFNQFEEERQRWELKVKELFESGELLFKNISENFEKNIAEAKQEFELNMAMRIGAGTTKVKALVDMYLVCASAAITAKENIEFWQRQYGDGKKDPAESGFMDWFYNAISKIWIQTESKYVNSEEYISLSNELIRLKKIMNGEIPPVWNENAYEKYYQYLAVFNEKYKILSQIQDIIAGKMTMTEEIAFVKKNNISYFSKMKYEALLEMKNSYDLYTSYMEKAIDARDRILADYAELIGAGYLKDILASDVSSEDFYLDEYQIALIRAKALVLYWERKTAIAGAVLTYAGELDAGRMTEAEGIRAWENAKAAYNESLAVYEIELKKLNAASADIYEQQIVLDNLTKKMFEAEEKLNRINNDYSAIVAAGIINTKSFTLQDLNASYNLLAEEYRHFLKTGNDAAYKNILEYGIKWEILNQRGTAKSVLNVLLNGDETEMPSLAELWNNVLEGTDSEINLKIRLAGIDLFADTPSEQLRAPDSTYSGADWYSKAKGLNLSEEEKAALYGEKLGAQLVTDYKNSYRLLLEKRIVFELEALQNFLNEDPRSGSFRYTSSELCLIDSKTAAHIYQILLSLKERLELEDGYFTENYEENDIINFFISGGSFFKGSEQYFTEYFNEYFFCLGLMDLYNEYAVISSFVQNELWQTTCNSLSTLFADYDLNSDMDILPGAQSIIISISQKPGDFIQNAAQFLLEFDNCFYIMPQWLEIELNNWKEAITWYIAANAFNAGNKPLKNSNAFVLEQEKLDARYDTLNEYVNSLEFIDNNEAEKINKAFEKIKNEETLLYYMYQITQSWEKLNSDALAAKDEKHWRQYLKYDYLENFDPILTISSTWKDGTLTDALYNAVYYTNRVNDSFTLFSEKDFIFTDENTALYFALYLDEVSKIDYQFYSMQSQYNEIARLGRAFEFSIMNPTETAKQLEIQYKALKAQEDVFNTLRSEYLKEAEKFLNIGIMYDDQYSILKTAYDNTEKMRFEYEKQDAIRRWASTAYFDTDNIYYEEYNAKLTKAQTVLTVLSDLYSNEKQRPYDNLEYNALYSRYEQSFSRKMTVMETLEFISSSIVNEYMNNETIFSNYQNSLNKLGNVDQNYSDYISPDSKSKWSIKDIITVTNGRLAFSKNESMTLTGIDTSKADDLDNYFNSSATPKNEQFEISQFEEALRGLSQRMAGYFKNSQKFRQWSLARNYLLSSLIEANGDLKFLNNYLSELGSAGKDGSLGSLKIQTGVAFYYGMTSVSSLFSDYFFPGTQIVKNQFIAKLDNECRTSWERLSKEEKADLEFYVILTLSGKGNDYISGFSQMYTLDVYDHAYDYVDDNYSYARKKASKWYTFGIYDGMRDINRSTLKRVKTALSYTKDTVERWKLGLQKNISSIQNYASAYTESCKKINAMEGKNETGQSIGWYEINLSILTAGKTKNEDIVMLKLLWEEMQTETDESFQCVTDALAGLVRWTRNAENKNKNDLENYWLVDEQIQQKNEYDYRKVEEAFIAGTISLESLKLAAEKTYGNSSAVWKKHLDNTHTVLLDDLSSYLKLKNNFFTEFNAVGNDITQLTSKAIAGRYSAEFAGREIEWNQMRQDISEKYYEWLNSAAKILENGRTDWNDGIRKMEEAYRQWNVNFQNEYNRISAEWAEAYLAGLEDKEKWLEQAAAAANEASAESFLSLVGTEGERLSRFMDTREPFGIRNAVPEAETLMAELLQASGISNMVNVFGSLNNTVNIVSPLVRQGMGGISTWDTALAKTAASDLARKTNTEIANSEARKLARSARLSADAAINNLIDTVNLSNKNFQESMDDHFILNGLWRKNGNNYVKDIITGSTLFEPIITKTANVTGYKNYIMEPISLRTNIDENYLAGFDSIIIRGLVENVFLEVETIANEIFGIGKDSIKINKTYLKEREQSPGKFGAHIGYDPAVKPSEDMGSSKKSIFYDQGSGELGRLMSEYIYWAVIDGRGSAELEMAPWDKRMWDDSNSSFKAPSLRSTGQFIGSVVGTVVAVAATPITGGASIGAAVGMATLVAGINSTNDFVFGALDVAFGYKTIDEAAFEWGKSSLINLSSSMISGAFSGFGGVGSVFSQGITSTAMNTAQGTVNKILTQTLLSGTQAFTTGLVTSAISGITYNSKDGWGYSGEIASAGFKNMLTSTVTSMASAFTTSSLQAVNSGFSLEKLEGFSKLNKSDLSKFNNLAGSLAGQGINYAMGNDFTLNLLNLSLLPGVKYSSGLLELHLGRGSSTMNIGTGGANISIDNLYSSLKGAMVWDVNSRISNYTKKNSFDAENALRALYGYGDNVQTGQLWDILRGNTEIRTVADGDFRAETTIIDGKRVINLTGYQSGMKLEEQMRLAAILGHEAYRDGIVTEDNHLETRMATLTHTKMALKMLFDGQELAYDDNLAKDISAYLKANGDMALFNDYVDSFYDSSGDFWKLTKDADGTWFWDDDKSADFDIRELLEDRDFLKQQRFKKTIIDQIFNNTDSRKIDGKPLGVISANRMTSSLAEMLGVFISPPFYDTKPNLDSLKETIPFEQQVSLAGLTLFNDTLDKIAYNAAHTTTIYNSDNKPVTLFNIDTENKTALLRQTDDPLSTIHNLYWYGCYFMDIIAVPQLLTKQAFDSQQIMEIWNLAIEKDIMKYGGEVKSNDGLTNLALQKLGITDFGIDFGKTSKENASLIGYRLQVPYNSTNVHFVLTGVNKSLVYNPSPIMSYDKDKWVFTEIWVYGK